MSVGKKQAAGSKRTKSSKQGGALITSVGEVHVHATQNNTIVTFVNTRNETVAQCSGGAEFRNAKKSTAEAAMVAAKRAGEYVKSKGMSSVSVRLKGVSQGSREGAMKGLVLAGLTVTTLQDVTPIAHNGPKKKKRQRK